MGGCCCCSSRRSQLNGTPLYYYCPQTLEEHESLSSHHGAASVLSTGLLIDINLETSTPDSYRAPPVPLPYDVDLGRPQTPVTRGSSVNKSGTVLQTTDIEDVGEIKSGIAFETSATCEGLKELVCESDINSVLTKEPEVELSKLSEPIVSATEEEDVCPTCFEEYDSENPKIITKCQHHFHLSCILEWMERSDTCPVCDQKMMLNHTSTG